MRNAVQPVFRGSRESVRKRLIPLCRRVDRPCRYCVGNSNGFRRICPVNPVCGGVYHARVNGGGEDEVRFRCQRDKPARQVPSRRQTHVRTDQIARRVRPSARSCLQGQSAQKKGRRNRTCQRSHGVPERPERHIGLGPIVMSRAAVQFHSGECFVHRHIEE